MDARRERSFVLPDGEQNFMEQAFPAGTGDLARNAQNLSEPLRGQPIPGTRDLDTEEELDAPPEDDRGTPFAEIGIWGANSSPLCASRELALGSRATHLTWVALLCLQGTQQATACSYAAPLPVDDAPALSETFRPSG